MLSHIFRDSRSFAPAVASLAVVALVWLGPTTKRAEPAPANSPKNESGALPRDMVLRAENIGLTALVTPVGLTAQRSISVPENPQSAGWFDLPSGGKIIVGHADSLTGPAVFSQLSQLRPDDRIELNSGSGRPDLYYVISFAVYPVDDFPDEKVYLAKKGQLKLITCAGDFDRRLGRYSHNLVVTAAAADQENTD